MKKLLVMISLLLPASGLAANNVIDNELASCLNRNSSTVGMAQCYDAAMQSWDQEMNRQYSAVMKKLNNQQKAKLRDAQRNWLKYRDSWLEAAQAWYLAEQGTLAGLSTAAQAVQLVKGQALMLKSLNQGSCANPDDCQ
ncbi:lysozyme inhibitor LprI family protein [Pantoea sp. B65]|uniref:lysozyme inhibitor LprI family protein n=1 Tax=Pantoea sp. B65 TaxID=2813359 RepID=UPI0039B5C4CB